MLFMNEHEIENAQRRFADDDVLAPATESLARLCDAVNRCSDGWSYWKPPLRASQKLQALIQGATTEVRNTGEHTVTTKDMKAALTPIKTFLAKHPQVQCQLVEV